MNKNVADNFLRWKYDYDE